MDDEISNKLYWTLGYDAGVELERERIIKILENHRISIKDISVENWIGLWHDAIAKVKEEQK